MKYILAFVLNLVSCSILFSQESSIYTESGLLKIDPEFSIEKNRIEDFQIIEEYALSSIYNLISYPGLASENGIQGTVIVKILLNEHKTLNYSIVKYDAPSLIEPVKFALNKMTKYITYLGEDLQKPFEFYIPIKFELMLDTFESDIKQNGAIIIKGTGGTKEKLLIKEK